MCECVCDNKERKKIMFEHTFCSVHENWYLLFCSENVCGRALVYEIVSRPNMNTRPVNLEKGKLIERSKRDYR